MLVLWVVLWIIYLGILVCVTLDRLGSYSAGNLHSLFPVGIIQADIGSQAGCKVHNLKSDMHLKS